MRTEKSIINLMMSLFGQVISMLASFITRIVFIKFLGETYLGINGLFSQVLSMLSLVELGIGTAIIFSLYKPLAQNDNHQVAIIMSFYKKVYTTIGILIAVLGLAISPFYWIFMNEVPDISHLQIIFLLFVANSSISYFFSYKQNLIIADQKKYITLIYHYCIYISLCIIQIIALYYTRNFIIFLVLQIICTLTENIIISKKADKLYPFLKEKNKETLDDETYKQIKKNTKALLFHKIGGIAVNATDNILISKLINVGTTGIYSNYLLVTTSLTTLITQAFSALTSSVGNLNATVDNDYKHFIFNVLFYINFVIYTVTCISLIMLFNDFIMVAFGKMLLPSSVVVLIVINFFLAGMRQTILTFRDAMGIYWADRYRPLFEAAINLGMSILLFQFIGLAGIFVGTTISAITTYLWIEPVILFSNGFKRSSKDYFKKYFIYMGCAVIFTVFTYLIVNNIQVIGWASLFIKAIITVVLVFALCVLCFYRTKEFKYILQIIKEMLKKIKQRSRR